MLQYDLCPWFVQLGLGLTSALLTCPMCGAGFYSTGIGSSACLSCLSGTYSNTNWTACNACPAGSTSAGASACSANPGNYDPCQVGSFSNAAGLSTCIMLHAVSDWILLSATGLSPCAQSQSLTQIRQVHLLAASEFQPTTTSNMAQFLETLRQKLSSPCAYTNHYLLQLTAWTLHKNIEIHEETALLPELGLQ